MINILIRTHLNPKGFDRCIKSIESQTYKNWRIIISVDNQESVDYVSQCGYEYIRVNEKQGERPWNLYLNTLQLKVEEGFILYMDDDIVFDTNNSLRLVADNSRVDKLLVFRFRIEGGRGVIPDDDNFGKRIRRDVNTECFSHHMNHRVKWRNVQGGDYFAMIDLRGRLKVRWLDKIIFKG